MNRLRQLLNGSRRPLWMGIVNATPDSFSDGGAGHDFERAEKLLSDGADMLDLGGESTNPKSTEVDSAEELARVLPLVRRLRTAHPDACLTVDTRKSDVADACLTAGADAINDVSMLRFSPDMAETVARHRGTALILMHSRGLPQNMKEPRFTTYTDVVKDVCGELADAVEKAVSAGVPRNLICVDPGLGFAKTPDGDFALLGAIAELKKLGPVLIAHSRKSFLGSFLGIPEPCGRESATVAVSLFAARRGADIIRVHDVAANRRARLAFERCEKEVR